MTRRLNWRVLAILLGSLLLLGGSVHFVHAAQLRRNASSLLEQSTKFEAENRLADAAYFLTLYVKREPSDIEARARLALLRVKLARTQKELQSAYQGLEDFLRNQPDQDDVRRKAIDIAMSPKLGRYSDARHHLVELRKGRPNDAELELLLGLCFMAEKNYEDSSKWLVLAIEHAPTDINAYVVLAKILREHRDRAAEADEVMKRLVTTIKSADAYLARARYFRGADKPAAAAKDIEEAGKLAPDHAEVLLARAQLTQEQKKTDDARKILQRGIKLHSKDVRFYLLLAQVEGRDQVEGKDKERRLAKAVECLRQGLEALPNNTALLWDLATNLIDSGKLDEVSNVIVQLRKARMAEPRLDYLDAGMLVALGRWHDAAARLDQAYPQLEPWPDLTRQADILMGRCYAQLGDTDRQYAAYQRAVKADPVGVAGCLGLANAHERLGKPDEAAEVYQRIATKSSQAFLAMIRLRIARTLAQQPEERRWPAITRLLDEAEKALPDHRAEVEVLRAQALVGQGKAKEAVERLGKLRKEKSDDVTLWLAEAALIGQDKPEAALALLDEAGGKLGDRVELRLARAAQFGRLGDKGSKELAALEQGIGGFTPEQRRQLWRGLAEANARAGDNAQAVRLYQLLATEKPNDLGTRMALFDLALVARDVEAIDKAVGEIRRIETEEGTFWRYGRACALVVRARAGDRAGLDEARRLLKEVGNRRPGWSRVTLIEAEIAFLAGDRSLGIEKLQKAVAQGDRSPDVLRHLFEQLASTGRADEADRVVRMLPEQSLAASQLNRLAAQVSMQTRDYDRALSLAQKAVADDAKDYKDHVWMAQMLWAAGKRSDAEARFRRAAQLAPTVPEPWQALVQFLARTGKKEDAIKVIAEARGKIAPEKAALALAQCHEAVGESEKARPLFEKALQEKPGDVAVLRGVVSFRLRSGNFAEAETLLQQVLDLKSVAPADAAWARRTLAKVLAFQGNYAKSRRAVELITADEKTATGQAADSADEARARALVFSMQRARADRVEGIRVLEALAGRQPLTPEDRFLLAQLHESVGDWPRARAALTSLVNAEGDNPIYLARYIRGLLRHSEADQAAGWLAKLEKLQPESLQTLELKCRVLKAEGKGDQTVALLSKHAEREGANLLRLADLLADLGQPKAAEELYRRWAAKVKKPEASLVLALFLARQNRLPEALALCEDARKTLPPELVVGAAVEAIYAADLDRAQCERVGRWIEDLLQKSPKKAVLLGALATVRGRQGDFDQAVALYRRTLAQDATSPIALNNLAYLLALTQREGAEALTLLDRAEKAVGSVPNLLDTRAVVLLTLGQADKAVSILEEVVAVNPTPTGCFHLAQASLAAQQPLVALNSWNQARALGLKPTDLHPLERPALEKLKGELKAKFPEQFRD